MDLTIKPLTYAHPFYSLADRWFQLRITFADCAPVGTEFKYDFSMNLTELGHFFRIYNSKPDESIHLGSIYFPYNRFNFMLYSEGRIELTLDPGYPKTPAMILSHDLTIRLISELSKLFMRWSHNKLIF